MNPKHRTSGENNEFDAYADAYDEFSGLCIGLIR
jgi:hypothetical protein